MAVVNPTKVADSNLLDFKDVYRIQWKDIKAGDTCAPIALARYTDRSFQISDTLSGATVAMHGTLDTEYAVLKDGEGIALTALSSNQIKYIQEPTAYLKPIITGGDGSTNITITLMATRSNV